MKPATSTGVENCTEAKLQIKCNNLQLGYKIESCEDSEQDYQIQSKSGQTELIKSKSIKKLKIRRI